MVPGLTNDPQKFCDAMTLSGSKVEFYTVLNKDLDKIVIGQVKKIEKHPDADHLVICQVDVGDKTIQIVTGAQNVFEGAKVPVVLDGGKVAGGHDGSKTPGGITIKKGKLRGVESDGMMCSIEELGSSREVFPDAPVNGLYIMDEDAPVGDDAVAYLGLDDVVVEYEITSNRVDCFSIIGLAREAAATFGLPFNPPEVKEVGDDDDVNKYISVDVENHDLCKRYTARVVKNIHLAPSPKWMQERLRSQGIRPINNIVDITNYVMMAVGQPMHAFDSSHVEGEKIVVRNAKPGETLQLLDGKELDLNEHTLMICDCKEPMGLAGIKGGMKDSILDDTTSVLLEVADFTAPGIRRTEREFDEKTDSGMRYEKGIDTQRVDLGLDLALRLFKEIYPECSITAFSDVNPIKTEKVAIDITQEFLDRRLGEVIAREEIEDILGRLGYEVEFENGVYHCKAPTWRSTGDVSIHDDILGDIARLIGYEYFEKRPLTVNFEHSVNQVKADLSRKMREYLAFRCGMNEIFTYPWIDEKYITAAGTDIDKSVRLATPPAPELGILRSSLIPGMLESIEKNARYFDEFAMFEAAQAFEKGSYSPSSEDEVLPVHKNLISGTFAGKDAKTLFYKVKGVVEGMGAHCHFEPFTFKQKKKPSWADEKVWLNIMEGGKIAGSIGLISVQALTASGIKMMSAAAFEIDMDAIKPYPSRTNEFKHLPQYPLVEQDLSLLVDESVKWGDIREAIKFMVKDLKFVEEYRGKQIPAGKKSIMLSLKIGNDDSTMTSKQIEKKMNGIIKVLGNKCGAQLR